MGCECSNHFQNESSTFFVIATTEATKQKMNPTTN